MYEVFLFTLILLFFYQFKTLKGFLFVCELGIDDPAVPKRISDNY